uniref:FXYD domain-containing ion transport regulator n=1 Tax=Neogobius melanostomus TaxID=47308 RepID=A0A8C6TYX3_9GOBI
MFALLLFTATDIDYDADFVYDYHTLRIGGLIFAGVVTFIGFIILTGNKFRNCGKHKVSVIKKCQA